MEHFNVFDKQLLTSISNGLRVFKDQSLPGGYDQTFKARLNSLRRLLAVGYIHPYFDRREQMTGGENIAKVYDIFVTDSGKQYLKINR